MYYTTYYGEFDKQMGNFNEFGERLYKVGDIIKVYCDFTDYYNMAVVIKDQGVSDEKVTFQLGDGDIFTYNTSMIELEETTEVQYG
jgi:hypothetical protein